MLLLLVLPFFLFPPNAFDSIFDIFFDLVLPLFPCIDAVVSNNDALRSLAKSAKPNCMLLRFFCFDLLDCCFFEMDAREAGFDSCVRRISAYARARRRPRAQREQGREVVSRITQLEETKRTTQRLLERDHPDVQAFHLSRFGKETTTQTRTHSLKTSPSSSLSSSRVSPRRLYRPSSSSSRRRQSLLVLVGGLLSSPSSSSSRAARCHRRRRRCRRLFVVVSLR